MDHFVGRSPENSPARSTPQRHAWTSPLILATCAAMLGGVPTASAQQGAPYRAVDVDERPAAGETSILPTTFLRGYDPVTVYFERNMGPGRGPADDGAKRLRMAPEWPGAYQWLDARTLQFRPAEPWPALARFEVVASGKRRVLTTMMSAPTVMSPPDGATDLPPFRSFSLTFATPLSGTALKQMLHVEVREAPGISSSKRRVVEDFEISALPRSSLRDPQTYAVTMHEAVPEGSVLLVELSLALDDKDKVMWQGRAATKPPFHLAQVVCEAETAELTGGGGAPEEHALNCGHSGEGPQLVFSAPPKDLTLSQLRRLVKLSPNVQDLHFKTFGRRIQLQGRFLPDVLYRMRLEDAPIVDDNNRPLAATVQAAPEVFFFLGFKRPFVRWSQGQGVLEANGPRMMPVRGYGDRLADLRIHRIDPLSTTLWPYPSSPIILNEDRPPPFPGEEPAPGSLASPPSVTTMSQHLRLLGTPLVSRITELPLVGRAGVTDFGLDLGQSLDEVVGKNRPGHYLVGLRRLEGAPQRAWVRVQITNLSLTTVEEHDSVTFFVRRLDNGEPVSGARVVLEGLTKKTNVVDKTELTTNARGQVEFGTKPDWTRILRVSVGKGEDVLVIDPNEPPPSFADFHWSTRSGWLNWLTASSSAPPTNTRIAFVVTDRPIYRPGDTVEVIGWVREKDRGVIVPANVEGAKIRLNGPGGKTYDLQATISPLGGISAKFQDDKAPTGNYSASILLKGEKWAIGGRPFKVEAYRVPRFEVQMVGPSRAALDGPFKVKAIARYYAGGNVAGANVQWRVTERPYFHVPKGREGFIFASSSQFGRSESGERAGTNQSSGTLDENGAMSLEINPALNLNGAARLYRFEATVTGADNQQVSAVHEVAALPAFTLGMKVSRYLPAATDIAPEIIATGVDDRALEGQPIKVKLFRRNWHSHLRETQFATGEASYVTEQEDTLLSETVVKSRKTPLKVALPVKTSGVYIVELEARDKLGRVQTLRADLFVGGKEGVAWQKSQHGVFDLSTDKRLYAPGETAQVLIKSPFASGHALVIVEGPQGNAYTWVNVQGSKAVVPVKITAEHAPNLPLHVVLMRGRLGDPKSATSDDSRYRPQTVASTVELQVRPVDNQLVVEVKHAPVVQPGSKQPFTISLKDPAGRPLAGEVTLWLVDEAVLSLVTEGPLDPLTSFIVENRRRSAVRDTRNSVVGRLAEEEESPGGDGAMGEGARAKKSSGFAGGKSRRRVRRNFATVPYYAASLTIPASGTRTVEVNMSDDLTNFSVRAVAASGRGRFGFVRQQLRVRLPVIVQPQLPRFARQGDRFAIGGVARVVEGDGGAGTVDVTVDGPIDGMIRPKAVTLDSKNALSVTWPITIRAAGQNAALTMKMGVTRTKDGVGDAFEATIPIFPDRALEKTQDFFTLSRPSTPLPRFAESPRAGTLEQVATVTRIDGLLPAALGVQSLVEYPHGCLEQQLSQLLPQIELATFASSLGARAARPDVVEKMAALSANLQLYQSDAGLFSYWPGGPTDVALTAQVLEFFDVAETLKVVYDAKVRALATSALRRALRSDYAFLRSYRYNQQTTALAALARQGDVDEHYLIDLYHDHEKMDATAAADLLRTMSLVPARLKENLAKNTAVLLDDMWSRVVFTQDRGTLRFDRVEDTRKTWDLGVLGSSTSTLAAVLESLSIHDGKNPRLPLLRKALLARAGRDGFGTTHDNRRAVRAIVRSLEGNGETIAPTTLTFGATQTVLNRDTKLASLTLADDVTSIRKVGTGEVYALLRRTFLPQKPGDRVDALANGFVVTRAFEVYPSVGGKRRYDDERGKEREMEVGDIVELSTTLVSDEDRFHVALVVPFAAGLEPLNPALKTAGADAVPSRSDSRTPTYVQRLDHEVRYYFDFLPKGTHAFHFRARATVEGSFTHPPPVAEGMYAPEVRGRGVGQRFIIGPANDATAK